MEFLSPMFQDLIRVYAENHADSRNRWTHIVGIPLIMFSILGLLGQIPLPGNIRLDLIVWGCLAIFYWKNTGWLAIPFVLIILLLCVLGQFLPVPTLWLLLAVGWLSQFLGHYLFEKSNPSFMSNSVQLLIGPFWVYCYLVRRVPGYRGLFTNH